MTRHVEAWGIEDSVVEVWVRHLPETDLRFVAYEALPEVTHEDGDDTSAHPMRAQREVLDVDGGGVDVLRDPVSPSPPH